MRRFSLGLTLLVGCSFPTAEFHLGSTDAALQTDSRAPDVTPDAPRDVAQPDVVTPDVAQPDTGVDAMVDAAPDVPVDATVPNCDPLGRPTCPTGTVCAGFTCAPACGTGESMCGGACRSLQTDDDHCGACGTSCGTTGVCRAGACVPRAGTFRVASLGSAGCTAVEHATLTGSAHGALGVSSHSVFISGTGPATGPATITARFNVLDLTEPSAVMGRTYESLVTNLRDGTVYTFAAGGVPLPAGGGTASRLLEINPTTGVLTGRIIGLSTPLAMTGSTTNQVGIFSGYDRVVLLVGTRVINITVPAPGGTGMVTDLGSSLALAHTACPSWAYWGLAETDGADVNLVYVQNATTVARSRVGMRPNTTALATFSDLGAMCGIGASIPRNRWYFQVAGTSQFGAGTQTLGFCPAVFER